MPDPRTQTQRELRPIDLPPSVLGPSARAGDLGTFVKGVRWDWVSRPGVAAFVGTFAMVFVGAFAVVLVASKMFEGSHSRLSILFGFSSGPLE